TSRTGHRPALRDGRFVESPDAFSARIGTMNSGRAVALRESVLECGSPYVFSVFAGRANGARTLVHRKIGRRRSLEISKRGSALPAFLRDKSRATGEFSVGALNRYGMLAPGSSNESVVVNAETAAGKDRRHIRAAE